MSNNKKILFLFTDSFPYGYNENYILSEQQIINVNFSKIYYFPLNCNNEGVNRFDKNNTSVVNLHSKYNIKTVNYFTFLKIYFYEFFCTNSKLSYLNKKSISSLINAIYYAERILKFIKEENIDINDIVFYSYWNYHWALVIAIVKHKFPQAKAISRAHLHDLYDFLTFNLFANFKYNNLNAVYPISEHGQKYLQQNYPLYQSKFKVSKLGVSAHQSDTNATNEYYVIASCSLVREQKRVDKIIDILSHSKLNIHWHHFGGGALFNQLSSKAKELPTNIKCTLHNNVPNDYILHFYKKNKIDLFINVSYEEGIPFSLMEIISFGVPIMACDVYGNKEICTEHTGILIEKDFNTKDVATSVDDFLVKKPISKEMIINFWRNNFDAEKNYNDFIKSVIN